MISIRTHNKENNMTHIINGIKTENQIKRENFRHKVMIRSLAFFGCLTLALFIDTPAQAAIILDKSHEASCYDFKTVQDIDAIVIEEFDSHYSEDIDDYFKLYYTNKTPDAEGKFEVLTEAAYNKQRSDLKSKIMLSPCIKTKTTK